MGNMIADMLLNNMSAGDNAKVKAWVQQNIVQSAIEELLKPDNLKRLAVAIAMEIKLQVVTIENLNVKKENTSGHITT